MRDERSESQRAWMEGGMLSGVVIMALVLFGMVNYLSSRHYKRFDATSSKLYTLSEKSENVMASLTKEIEAAIFLSPQSELYAAADELLSRYEAANPSLFKKRTIDPAKNMLEAQRLIEKYNVEKSNVIVIASGDDRRVIDEFDLAEYDYSGAQFGQGPTLQEFKGEQQITSAILELVEAKKPKIVFTTAHGEPVRALSKAKIYLGNDNFEFEDWNFTQDSVVPPGADLVVVVAPATGFFEPELDLMTSYLEGGGRMLFLLDPAGPEGGLMSYPRLGPWLERYGVKIGDDVVIDPDVQMAFFGPETIFSASYGPHPIVENLDRGQRPVHLTFARSVSKSGTAPAGYEITELVRTSAQAWGETNIEDVENIQADEGEVEGPIALGLAVSFEIDAPESDTETEPEPTEGTEDEGAEDEGKAPEARLVVFGDVDFAADAQIESAANGELLINTFNWLVEREQLIAIEGRKPEKTQLSMTSSELMSVFLIVFVALPAAAVVAGISVFFRRRR